MELPESVYLPDGRAPDGERFVATELARGPWDPNAQHGGPATALLARAVERHEIDVPVHVTRLTTELLRPVPLGPITVRARTIRPGKKVQLVEAGIVADEVEVARAVGLRIREKDLPLPTGADQSPDRLATAPEEVEIFQFEGIGPVSFGRAMDLAALRGGPRQVGPATVWFRLKVPLIAGEETSPLMRIAAAADFGNGVSSIVDWDAGWVFINPDLTIYANRYPVGEWIGVDAVTHASDRGVGYAEVALYDVDGRVGRSVQALLFDFRVDPS
jgi:hypothetical protein